MKKENILKRWYKLCQPSKWLWFFQILTYVGYAVFLVIITIFAARTINCMYNANWKGAFINLMLELMTIIARNLLYHFEYICYGKHYCHIRKNVSHKVFNKFVSCSAENFKKINKEKIVNIAINNMSYLCEFPDAVAGFLAYIVQVVIALTMVFTSNIYAGLIVTALGVVNFFAYYLFNKKLGKIMNKRFESKDEVFKTYNKVLTGKKVINELGAKNKYNQELDENLDEYEKQFCKYQKVYSSKSNLWYIVWNCVVYAIASFLMFSVSKGKLDIAIYLVIVPYLTTCTEKLNSLFDKTNAIENMRVDVDRIDVILDMNEEELIQFGEMNKDVVGDNLGLIDVSYKYKSEDGGGEIVDFDLSFKMGALNIVKGEKGSGKRAVFDLLRRQVVPDKGKVLLDNLDLYTYNEKTFKNHINYCSSHPFFLEATIEENLSLVEKDIAKITEMCEKVGALNYIMKLDKGFATPINEIQSKGVLFLLGLARAMLSNSEILMIYELPEDVSDSFRKKILKLLTKNTFNKTIVVFTHSDTYDQLQGMHCLIKNGKLKQIKYLENKD